MPYGFQYVGAIGGALIIVMVATITWYAFYVLIDTKKHFVAKGRNPVTYAEIGTEAFGRKGRFLVNVAILANQTGVLAAYQQFIGKNFLHITTAKSIMPLYGWVLGFLVVLGKFFLFPFFFFSSNRYTVHWCC
jgi:amino acid permease